MNNLVVEAVVATPDPPPTGVRNPIHDADGAAAAGYAGRLVAGVRTYGWAANAIERALGADWLTRGWVDFTLRRPLYAGEMLTTTVAPQDGRWQVLCRGGEDERVVLEGEAGLDSAPWLRELDPPPLAPGGAAPAEKPTYDLSSVPLRRPLVPLNVWLKSETASALVREDLGLDNDRYRDKVPVPVHPYFLAGRIAPLTRHNFTYGPTIHVRSQIQHAREGSSDRDLTVGAWIVDAYGRKGHCYQVLDGVVSDLEGELCRIRHHTIFRPRGAPTG